MLNKNIVLLSVVVLSDIKKLSMIKESKWLVKMNNINHYYVKNVIAIKPNYVKMVYVIIVVIFKLLKNPALSMKLQFN